MRAIVAMSMLALAASPAFAYSNVSPKPSPQKVTSMQRSMRSFSAFDAAPLFTITPDNYRYHGGPKESE
jgi:hypothetical protein